MSALLSLILRTIFSKLQFLAKINNSNRDDKIVGNSSIIKNVKNLSNYKNIKNLF